MSAPTTNTQIRRFSTVLVVASLLVVGIGVSNQFLTFARFGEAGDYQTPPWFEDDPGMAQLEDDGVTWRARGGSGIVVSDELGEHGVAQVTLLSRVPRAAMTGYTSPGVDPKEQTTSYGSIIVNPDYPDAATVIMQVEPGGTIWVNGVGNWRASVTPLEYVEIDEVYEGTGPATLRYQGDFGAAVLTGDGDSIVSLDLYAPEDGHDFISKSFDETRTHFSWAPGEAVFQVRARPGVNWALQVYEVVD